MATKGFVALTAIGLALGAAVWAAKPPRTSGKVDETAIGDRTPTFYKDVLPIVQQHCQTCHRPGHLGRFPSSIIRALVPGPKPSRARSPREKCRLGWRIQNTGILTTTVL